MCVSMFSGSYNNAMSWVAYTLYVLLFIAIPVIAFPQVPTIYIHVYIYSLGLEQIPNYPDNYPQLTTVSLYPDTHLMFAHAQKPNMWSQNCNKMAGW